MATQVVSRVRAALGREITIREMFDRPTVAGMAERIDKQMREGGSEEEVGIERVSREGRIALSYAQQRLWFLDQLEPGSSAYNIGGAVRLEGELDVGALERSINHVVGRHETLRTRFEVEEGEPVQVINDVERLSLRVEDLRGEEEGQRERVAREIAAEEARKPFELRSGPMLRVKLVRLKEEEHVLVMSMHHIVSDGWSMGVLVREVSESYEAYSRGEEPGLGELTVQYGDYAVWQRKWLRGEVLERQLKYWREALRGAETLELPTDGVRAAVANSKGGKQRRGISKEVMEQVKQMSRREGVTLFMSLLAGVKVVLSRYSGQRDISVGTPIAGRRQVEVEGLIGFFVNTLVMRSEVRGEATFREVVRGEREAALGAYGHQDVPFEKLVEELEVKREMSRTPLFDVMVVLQNAPEVEVELRGMKVRGVEVEGGGAKFDLTIGMGESEEGMMVEVEYRRELYEEVTMQRMMGHVENVLREGSGGPGRRVGEIEMLSGGEREQIVREWNDTEEERGGEERIHEVFEREAERRPEGVAVV